MTNKLINVSGNKPDTRERRKSSLEAFWHQIPLQTKVFQNVPPKVEHGGAKSMRFWWLWSWLGTVPSFRRPRIYPKPDTAYFGHASELLQKCRQPLPPDNMLRISLWRSFARGRITCWNVPTKRKCLRLRCQARIISEGPQWGSQIPLSRPFFPVNPTIPPFFTWKSQSRLLFKDVSGLIINFLN